MISIVYLKRFCCEDISLIENYEKAINDDTQIWHCHHRFETDKNLSMKELIDKDLYYHRPANELIFLTHSEHISLHRKGKELPEETRKKIRETNKGHSVSDETRRKISKACKGKKQSEETIKRKSESRKKPIAQIDRITGDVIKEWDSAKDVQLELGFCKSSITECCQGKRTSAYNYIWKYA